MTLSPTNALTTTSSGCLLLGGGLRLASQLHGDLTIQYEFASEIGYGFLGFVCSGKVDKGVTDRSGGTRIGGNGGGLA